MKNSLSKKQIPTLLGIGILIVSLVVGVLLVGQGGGVFAPRATPQTTPKKVKITNIKDTSFTVSFLTDDSTPGFVKYSTDQNNLKSQSSDDRDQLSGSVSPYNTHYITVRDVQPDTAYFFTLGTSSNSKFDNNGAPFTVHTVKKLDNSPAARTAYGSVSVANGGAASGAIVYITGDNLGEVSGLVKDSGSWAIPLSTARTADGSQYAPITDDSNLTITVQGTSVDSTATQQTTAKNTQPVQPIVLGVGSSIANASGSATIAQASPASPSTQPNLVSSQSAAIVLPNPSPVPSAVPLSIDHVVDVTNKKTQTVTTTQPVITGVAPANVSVSVTIHSTNPISTQVQSDSSGNFNVDLSALQQNLAPGKHTITFSYVDPATGKTVTVTRTFTVKATPSPSPSPTALVDNSVATQNPSDTTSSSGPFGTNNPFPLPSASTSTRVSRIVSTSSGTLPRTGSVDTTIALVFGGAFFIIAGTWSYMSSRKKI